MNATESLLFNKLFVEYLESVFMENDQRKFEFVEIGRSLPEFYQFSELVKAGMSFLLKKRILVQTLENGKDLYQISPLIVEERKAERENQDLNNKIDIEIKRHTLDQLKWDRIPKKYWWLISIGTAILGGLIARYLH